MSVLTRIILLCTLSFIPAFIPAVASAHAFGQTYTLPLPFSFYAIGAAIALVASFVFLGLYSDPVSANAPYMVRRFSPKMRVFYFIGGLIGISVFIFTLVLVIFGSNDFFTNPAPVLFWVALMLGMTYLSAIVGGLWRVLNPFERIARFFLVRHAPWTLFPEKYRYVPALIFYYILIWFELLSYGTGAMPWTIGAMLISYFIISFAGAFIYGADDWFQYGDMLNTFFDAIGYFAPIQVSREGIEVMPPGERLVERTITNMPLLLFVLFILASTAFDGLQDTQIWWATMYQYPIQINLYPIERALVLALSPFIFFALYSAAIYLMKVFTGSKKSYMTLALRFGYSLIPIAIAYNFAHYFMLFINEGWSFVSQISDPFAMGWNIFGTVGLATNNVLIAPQTVWYTQLSTIVIGHIVAALIAHRIALREFDTRKKIIVGQIPVLLLMVFYTVFGLWILSQGYQTLQ